jgi:hypothetical protein
MDGGDFDLNSQAPLSEEVPRLAWPLYTDPSSRTTTTRSAALGLFPSCVPAIAYRGSIVGGPDGSSTSIWLHVGWSMQVAEAVASSSVGRPQGQAVAYNSAPTYSATAALVGHRN